jgi:DNA-binding CsgD family transcriptional regulator
MTLLFENDHTVGICIKSHLNEVLSQTKGVQDICDSTVGDICHSCDGPVGSYSGIASQKNRLISGTHCDVAIVETQATRVVIVKSIEAEVNALKAQLLKADLTDQEQVIAGYVLDHWDNKRIIVDLAITQATLKTHLNHIYVKLPALKLFRESYRITS